MTANRIVFPGNPWPTGHSIELLAWSARLLPGPELWFDLHLRGAEYRAEDPESRTVADNDDDLDEEFDEFGDSDWPSRRVWDNYQRCTISSTQWGHRGFRVGVVGEPLHLARLADREFRVDDGPHHLHPDRREPTGPDDRSYYLGFALGGYVLGHVTVADHRIRFTGRYGGSGFDLGWRGRVSSRLGRAHEYTFRVTAANVRLDHIYVSPELTSVNVAHALKRVLVEADDFTLAEADGAPRFVCR